MTGNVEHDPLKYSIRWARGVIWQASRLREALEPPGPAEGVRPGFFTRLPVEVHFLLTAAAQLSTSLDELDSDLKLPPAMREVVRILRNVREHWNEWDVDKLSAAEFRKRWPNSSPWSTQVSEGRTTLAGQLDVDELETAAKALLAELLIRRGLLDSKEVALPLAPPQAAPVAEP